MECFLVLQIVTREGISGRSYESLVRTTTP